MWTQLSDVVSRKSFSFYPVCQACGSRFENPPKPAWSQSDSSQKTKGLFRTRGGRVNTDWQPAWGAFIMLSAERAKGLRFSCKVFFFAGCLKVTSSWTAASLVSPLTSYPNRADPYLNIYWEVNNHSKTDHLQRIRNLASRCMPHWLFRSSLSLFQEFCLSFLNLLCDLYPPCSLLFPPLHQLCWLAVPQRGC